MKAGRGGDCDVYDYNLSHKSEGTISLARGRPLLSDFSKIRFGTQITTTRHSRVIRDLRAEPAVPRTPSSHFAVRAFLFHARHPVSRVLRESRFGFPCGPPHRFPCGSRLRCSSEFRCRFSSEPRSRFSFRRSFRSSLAGSASGSVGDPFPALLRVPLPALRWLLSLSPTGGLLLR